jgi:hypothetical protein
MDKFIQFRESIFDSLKFRRAATIDLLDALCSNLSADSITKLSLSPHYQREYPSICRSISEFEFNNGTSLARLATPFIEKTNGKFYHLGLDVTPYERSCSKKLEDKMVVYKPSPIKSNKPIAMGHNYSFVNYLPSRTDKDPAVSMVLDVQRVSSEEKGHVLGAKQISQLMNDEHLPFRDSLTLGTGDTAYGVPLVIKALSPQLKKTSFSWPE